MNEKAKKKALSPVSRRAFLKGGSTAIAGGLFLAGTGAGCGGGGYSNYGDYGDICGYCDGSSRNYYQCTYGYYCDYLNYGD